MTSIGSSGSITIHLVDKFIPYKSPKLFLSDHILSDNATSWKLNIRCSKLALGDNYYPNLCNSVLFSTFLIFVSKLRDNISRLHIEYLKQHWTVCCQLADTPGEPGRLHRLDLTFDYTLFSTGIPWLQISCISETVGTIWNNVA